MQIIINVGKQNENQRLFLLIVQRSHVHKKYRKEFIQIASTILKIVAPKKSINLSHYFKHCK